MHDGSMRQILTTFIGRNVELQEITRLLQDPTCRLLTLLGPGGIGKTRLALETARQQAEHFPDGVFWVDLQSGQTPDFLVSAISAALSLSGHDNPRQQILRYLQDKTALLVLDNCEQFVDGVGLLTDMLQHGQGIKLLVTSRAALHLQEEWLYPLSGLPYPLVDQEMLAWDEIETFDAVQLFLERVRRVRPGFLPHQEQTGLLRICQLVDGMPLALELAASWARSLDCASIAAEIDRNLAFLTSILRNVPDRHRSIQAVFTHSWSLLNADEQAVFRKLAVFRGGFRRAAAEVVAEATLPLLTTLVDSSLLRWQDNGQYYLHELLRQYAEHRLIQLPEEATQARARHGAYYLDFLLQRTHAMLGSGQREAAGEIAAEFDNIRAAWQWAIQHQMIHAIGESIEPLSMFFHIKGRYLDAAQMIEDALHMVAAAEPATQPVKALVLVEMGWITIRLGQFDKAEQLLTEAEEIYQRLGLPPLPGQGTDPLLGLSTLASIRGEYTRAEQLAQLACQRATLHNHLNNLQTANYQLASIAHAQGNYGQAEAYAQTAYVVCEQTGDRWFMAYALNELGRAARALGDYETARRHFEASYALRESFSDPEGMALALARLGDIALRQARNEDAQQLYARSMAIYRKINDPGGLAAVYNGLGKTAVARGDDVAAQAHFRRALDIAAEIQFTPLLLAVLASIGQFLLQMGQTESGLALLMRVQQDAATDQETKTMVGQQLHQYLMHEWTSSPIHDSVETQAKNMTRGVDIARAALSTTLSTTIPTQGVSAQPEKGASPMPASLVEPLTEREVEVLQLISQGLTNREIAERLTVVVGTIKAHNNSIFGKLGVKNRGQAVVRARELNLL